MPLGQEGPPHGRLEELIANAFKRWLSAPEIGRLLSVRERLYNLRLIADYSAVQDLNRVDARNVLSMLHQATAILERIP
ncbi:hypothetical protein BH11PLA1_BH11PLA1_09750 [soil metagenome]